MATPRVAVIGGGLTGTLCSLVLQSRGVQPLLLQSGKSRPYLPFLRATSPRLAPLWSMLAQNGLVTEWKGRFGMLGKRGGFLPAEIVSTTIQRNTSDTPAFTQEGDYGGFVSNARDKTYKPISDDLLRDICNMAEISTVQTNATIAAEIVPEGGWKLTGDENANVLNNQVYDGLVVCDDASLSSQTVRSLAIQEQQVDQQEVKANGESIHKRLFELADELQNVSHHTATVHQLTVSCPDTNVDFDAVSVHGSDYLQFLAQESSSNDEKNQQHVWKAISTPNALPEELVPEVSRLLAAPASLVSCTPHAAPQTTLQLKEDCVTLAPWRCVLAGEYISASHASPVEAAATSALEAGEQAAAFFASS